MVVQETRTKHAEDGRELLWGKSAQRTMEHNQRDGRGGRVPAAVHVHGVSLVAL